MTYREVLEANKRSYRYMMMKNGVRTESSPASRSGAGCGSFDRAAAADRDSKSAAKLFIPPGAVINLLDIIEISSPGGISLKASLPFLGGNDKDAVASLFGKLLNTAGQSGGLINIVKADGSDKGDGELIINL